MTRRSTAFAAFFAGAAVFAGQGLAQDQEAEDDLRCRQWGAARGTAAYFECRAAIARERGGGVRTDGRGMPAPAPREENVSDAMALSLCEAHARRVVPHPIERLASSFVFPGREKRVTLSFKVSKPGSSLAFWNAECKFARGVMTNFSGR